MLQMLLFFLLPCTATSLKCFECHITKHSDFSPNVTRNLCENFDSSETFVQNCENNSLCRKTIITGDISSEIVGIERECVNDAFNIVLKSNKDGTWYKTQETISKIYSEECSTVESYGMRTVNIQHCYCNTDLCNSATSISWGLFLSTMPLFITLL